MNDREQTHRKAQQFFEELWQRGDHWELESSDYERARLDAQSSSTSCGRTRRNEKAAPTPH